MADTDSIDAIVAAFYEAFSGPQGPRDFTRLRALFRPGARLLRTAAGLEDLTVDAYLAASEAFFETCSLHEREVGRRVLRFGNVAHVLSAYEARLEPELEPLARGVNALLLTWDGERWWIASMAWDDETEERPIPDALLDAP